VQRIVLPRQAVIDRARAGYGEPQRQRSPSSGRACAGRGGVGERRHRPALLVRTAFHASIHIAVRDGTALGLIGRASLRAARTPAARSDGCGPDTTRRAAHRWPTMITRRRARRAE